MSLLPTNNSMPCSNGTASTNPKWPRIYVDSATVMKLNVRLLPITLTKTNV